MPSQVTRTAAPSVKIYGTLLHWRAYVSSMNLPAWSSVLDPTVSLDQIHGSKGRKHSETVGKARFELVLEFVKYPQLICMDDDFLDSPRFDCEFLLRLLELSVKLKSTVYLMSQNAESPCRIVPNFINRKSDGIGQIVSICHDPKIRLAVFQETKSLRGEPCAQPANIYSILSDHLGQDILDRSRQMSDLLWSRKESANGYLRILQMPQRLHLDFGPENERLATASNDSNAIISSFCKEVLELTKPVQYGVEPTQVSECRSGLEGVFKKLSLEAKGLQDRVALQEITQLRNAIVKKIRGARKRAFGELFCPRFPRNAIYEPRIEGGFDSQPDTTYMLAALSVHSVAWTEWVDEYWEPIENFRKFGYDDKRYVLADGLTKLLRRYLPNFGNEITRIVSEPATNKIDSWLEASGKVPIFGSAKFFLSTATETYRFHKTREWIFARLKL